ncbi:zinc-dependent metalloprotease [Ignavibacterium sp.]|uniref:zinc-dependent metalloprotease n=1 Tax=Ignavibacterium sp. TaxID=2651167 RepID=UPI00307DB354
MLVELIQQRPTTENYILVNLNLFSIMEYEEFSVPIIEDYNFVTNYSKKRNNENHQIWIGKNHTEEYTILTQIEDKITGTIVCNNQKYKIEPLGEGIHIIIKFNEKKLPIDHPDYEDIEDKDGELRIEDDFNFDAGSQPQYYDILVAYTQSAANVSGDIGGLIQTAINEANLSYSESQIYLVPNLVHTVLVNYDENRDYQTIVNHFRNSTDGYMDEIHSLRNQYKADICVLIVNNDDFCGIAYTIGASESNAFCVVHYDCATGYYSFGHEIGHLQGARHDKLTDPTGTYEHGYRYKPAAWRTIMAYDSASHYTRLNFWSNPYQEYPLNSGIKRGNESEANNVRKLNETANSIVGFRVHQLSGSLVSNQTLSGRTFKLGGNLIVPSGITLKIESTATLDLNGYYVASSGGSIVLQNGATVICSYLKQGSVLKGLFPSIQSAINYSSSGQTIELQPRTYNESCSFTNKSNRKLYGISTSSSTVNGLVSVTNSSYIEIANIKMNNLISINNSYNTNVNSSVFQSSTCINDYYGTSSDFGFSDAFLGGASFAFQSYGGTGDNYYNDISLIDCANYLTNNASYNIGKNNTFCENLSDIVADNGAYAYAISNDYSTPVPTSIYGNVFITGINGVCGSLKPVGKSSVFDTGNFYEDELLKKTDDKYLELLRLTRETKEDANLTQENYKSLFINLIEEYKSIFENAIDPKTSIFALRKISHLYNTLGEKEAFYSYINESLKKEKFSSIKNHIERFNVWAQVDEMNCKGALDIIHNLSYSPKESDTLVCELKYEEGLIYKYYMEDYNLANSAFNFIIQNYPDNIISNFALAEIIDNTEMLSKNSAVSNIDVSQFSLSNYPNPFNPATTISYSIPTNQKVTIKVYDILGKEVATLVNETKTAGNHQVSFNAGNLSSGIYIYMIQTNNFTASKKMLLIK